MLVGERIRELREAKDLSQGDVEQRTGLLRCYTSRVENGHTVPSLETMEKYARALEVPLYQLFYTGEEPPKPSAVLRSAAGERLWGTRPRDARQLARLCRALSKMDASKRQFLMALANALSRRKRKPVAAAKPRPKPAAPAAPAPEPTPAAPAPAA
jgi:transcriptional regulator with XRE-family HTH domain